MGRYLILRADNAFLCEIIDKKLVPPRKAKAR